MHPLHYFLSNIEKTNYFPITTFLPPMIYMPRFSDDISIDVSPLFLPCDIIYGRRGRRDAPTDTPVTDVRLTSDIVQDSSIFNLAIGGVRRVIVAHYGNDLHIALYTIVWYRQIALIVIVVIGVPVDGLAPCAVVSLITWRWI